MQGLGFSTASYNVLSDGSLDSSLSTVMYPSAPGLSTAFALQPMQQKQDEHLKDHFSIQCHFLILPHMGIGEGLT